MRKRLLAVPLAALMGAVPAPGAGAQGGLPHPAPVPALAAFLEGTWVCSGGTPSGRVMTAGVRFASSLDGWWLESIHDDVPPALGHMRSLWPMGRDTALASFVFDNFGGARRFTSSTWGRDSIVWVRDTTEPGARMETFTYRRTSDSTYWYGWHVRRTPGAPLVLGDSSSCRRTSRAVR